MTSTKSPIKVVRVALAAGKEAFSDYPHKFSPKKFTNAQLFACLVFKEFEKKDYRGVWRMLIDWPDLCARIGLKSVPHWTTLQKASRRLLTLPNVRQLLMATIAAVHGRRKVVQYAAADSSGFEARHASRYYVWRISPKKKKDKGKTVEKTTKRTLRKRYAKLMLVVNTATHAILAAVASAGPTPDIDQLDGVVDQLPGTVRVRHMVLDAGFDSAHNHKLLREQHGILTTIPPEHGRPPKDPATLPTDYWRRRMKTHFNQKAYNHRPQVETVFSMLKRNLRPALGGRTYWSRCRDLFLRVLTHNIMITP